MHGHMMHISCVHNVTFRSANECHYIALDKRVVPIGMTNGNVVGYVHNYVVQKCHIVRRGNCWSCGIWVDHI